MLEPLYLGTYKGGVLMSVSFFFVCPNADPKSYPSSIFEEIALIGKRFPQVSVRNGTKNQVWF